MTRSPQDPLPEPSERTRILRAAADDTLTPAERAALEAHLASNPEDEAVVAFERRMRLELGRAFSTDAAPPQLEERIRRMTSEGRPRSRRWVVQLAAAAAVLAVVALGIRLALRGDVDEFGFNGRSGLVRFLATHPRDCPITIDRTMEEFHVRHFNGAVSELGSLLGRAPALGDLAGTALTFQGMGHCGIPGHEVSMHLLFSGAMGSSLEGAMLSVYVQPDDGRLPITDGATYRLVPKTPEFSEVEMFVWRRDGLDYFVVAPDANAGQIMLACAGAPPVSAVL